MIQFFNLSFDNINGIEIAFDSKTRIIHLLEKNNELKRRVSEEMEIVQQQSNQRYLLFSDHTFKEIRWLLYNLEGVVSEYHDGGFKVLEMKHEDIFSPFSKKMMINKTCRQINGSRERV